jgi:hypothetical protein
MPTCNEVMDELVLEIKTSMIATDVNAHAQFNHDRCCGKRKPAK